MAQPMQMSERETVDLLNKWLNENRLVQCYVIADSSRVTFGTLGRIDSVQDAKVRISQTKSTSAFGDKMWVEFPIWGARCEYQAAEDTQEPLGPAFKNKGYDAVLTIYRDNATIGLAVLIPLNEWAKL